MNLSEAFAIGFDVGTTTIAGALVERGSGRRAATAGVLNPQRQYGLDVVTRLAAAVSSSEMLAGMKKAVNGALRQLTGELLAMAGVPAEKVNLMAIAGNPAMEHLLLGLPVDSLAFPPYRPLFTSGRKVQAADLGWEAPAETCVFPLPGGFVGGDLVAFLYGVDAAGTGPGGPRLFLDLGTNGELAMAVGGRIYATSAAAGPAFEGGNLACGMAALPGAISGVCLAGERVTLTTIDGKPPVGICGSGVIEAVAELLRSALLDSSGRLRPRAEIPSNLANRMGEIDGDVAFILYRDARRTVFLSQKDIRQVQLAKAAIRAGIEVLLERSGTEQDEVAEVILTGSFGATLDPERLKNVGVLTEKMVKVCSFVREGALAGVVKALTSLHGIEEIESIAHALRVVPLSGTPFFEKHFLAQMDFPHYGNS